MQATVYLPVRFQFDFCSFKREIWWLLSLRLIQLPVLLSNMEN
jgi:hypothetical protein